MDQRCRREEGSRLTVETTAVKHRALYDLEVSADAAWTASKERKKKKRRRPGPRKSVSAYARSLKKSERGRNQKASISLP